MVYAFYFFYFYPPPSGVCGLFECCDSSRIRNWMSIVNDLIQRATPK